MSERKKFLLSCTVGVSAFTFVEAETLDDAIEIARNRPVVLVGNGRGGEDSSIEWIIEEADGEPQDIHVDEP